MSNKSMIDVIKGIQQAAENGQDLPYGRSDTGVLKREEGHLINDSRVIDGFKVKIAGDLLIIVYNSVVGIESALEDNYESDLENILDQLSTFIKKEYKKITDKSLTLTAEKESFQARFSQASNVRMIVHATKAYKISGVTEMEGEETKENPAEELEEAKHWKKFLKGGVIKG